jgi:thiol-disulfide isomerase/thioredoxin
MKPTLLRILLLTAMSLASAVSAAAQESKGAPATLTGQMVCSVCWFEADRKTTPYGNAADMTCAQECADKGIPPAIAVKEADGFSLHIVQEGKFKKPEKDWMDLIGKQVKVSGRAYDEKEKHYIRIDALTVVSSSPEATQNSVVGSEAELSLRDLSGIEQRLSAFRGRVVVLNFWATWCVPCRKEMPDLAAIQNDYAAFGVQVVGASGDQFAEREKVIQFIKQTKINFPVWLGATTEDMRRFGVGPGLPATVIIGRDGKIAVLYPGVIKQAELKKELDRLLGTGVVAAVREAKTQSNDVSLVPS